MRLSLAETATVLGKSQRQLRYLIKEGRLKARKVGGRWMIDSDDLPLEDSQRQDLASRIAVAKKAFEKGLEPAAKAAGQDRPRQYSVTDLTAFQAGAALHREVAAKLGGEDPVCRQLAAALALVARGCHSFHPADKARRFTDARDLLADTTADLLLHIGDGEDQRRSFAERIEQELIPKIAGLIARQEKRNRRSRFERFGSVPARAGQPR